MNINTVHYIKLLLRVLRLNPESFSRAGSGIFGSLSFRTEQYI